MEIVINGSARSFVIEQRGLAWMITGSKAVLLAELH